MESNPEEFTRDSPKWGRMLEQVVQYKELGSDKLSTPNYLTGLTHDEIIALYNSYQKFLRKSFDDWVLKEVLNTEEELSYSMTSAPNVVLGHGGAGSSITINTGAGVGI
jgi:hypothetical protein